MNYILYVLQGTWLLFSQTVGSKSYNIFLKFHSFITLNYRAPFLGYIIDHWITIEVNLNIINVRVISLIFSFILYFFFKLTIFFVLTQQLKLSFIFDLFRRQKFHCIMRRLSSVHLLMIKSQETMVFTTCKKKVCFLFEFIAQRLAIVINNMNNKILNKSKTKHQNKDIKNNIQY